MSNKASNHLHELIKSLSSAEKRYFKIFADRHSTKEIKTYITLFDEIDRQDIYDEDCSMDNAYAASFVASEWLKKMPCGEGIEVCAS